LPFAACECSGQVKIIACIEDPLAVNRKILDHLKDKAQTSVHTPSPESRAPPAGLFG
jgi:hypothetical protein